MYRLCKNQSSPHMKKTKKQIPWVNIIQWQTCIFRAKVLSTSASSAKLEKTCQMFDRRENTTLCSRISVDTRWIPESSCSGIRGFGRRWKLVSDGAQKPCCAPLNDESWEMRLKRWTAHYCWEDAWTRKTTEATWRIIFNIGTTGTIRQRLHTIPFFTLPTLLSLTVWWEDWYHSHACAADIKLQLAAS